MAIGPKRPWRYWKEKIQVGAKRLERYLINMNSQPTALHKRELHELHGLAEKIKLRNTLRLLDDCHKKENGTGEICSLCNVIDDESHILNNCKQ